MRWVYVTASLDILGSYATMQLAAIANRVVPTATVSQWAAIICVIVTQVGLALTGTSVTIRPAAMGIPVATTELATQMAINISVLVTMAGGKKLDFRANFSVL